MKPEDRFPEMWHPDDDGDHSAFTHRDEGEPPPYDMRPATRDGEQLREGPDWESDRASLAQRIADYNATRESEYRLRRLVAACCWIVVIVFILAAILLEVNG